MFLDLQIQTSQLKGLSEVKGPDRTRSDLRGNLLLQHLPEYVIGSAAIDGGDVTTSLVRIGTPAFFMPAFTEHFDIVVVEPPRRLRGVAGVRADGLQTALYTLNVDLIAQMSCIRRLAELQGTSRSPKSMPSAASWERSQTRWGSIPIAQYFPGPAVLVAASAVRQAGLPPQDAGDAGSAAHLRSKQAEVTG